MNPLIPTLTPAGFQDERRFSSWGLRSRCDEDASFREHIIDIIDRVRPIAERIKGARSALESCTLVANFYLDMSDRSPEICLTSEQLGFLAKLGVDLNVHVYLPEEVDMDFEV